MEMVLLCIRAVGLGRGDALDGAHQAQGVNVFGAAALGAVLATTVACQRTLFARKRFASEPPTPGLSSMSVESGAVGDVVTSSAGKAVVAMAVRVAG